MSRNKQKRDESLGGIQLQGWPGYRTREQRSGLDPFDTRAEAGHMQGVFIRNLITLRARTRNPFYLILMFVLGVVPFVALIWLLLIDIPGQFDLVSRVYLALIILATGLVTINFIASILEVLGFISSTPGKDSTKNQKKKFPRRRKDFK